MKTKARFIIVLINTFCFAPVANNMPITAVTVAFGPLVQRDGRHLGRFNFEVTGGRVFYRDIQATDLTEWTNLQTTMQPQVLAEIANDDAYAAAESAQEINSVFIGEATREEVAVAYLRLAWRLRDPYDAYLLFDRFNDYRVARGWTVEQVVTNLTAAGLTQSEWDDMLAAYLWLDDANRVAAMQLWQTIMSNWEARND